MFRNVLLLRNGLIMLFFTLILMNATNYFTRIQVRVYALKLLSMNTSSDLLLIFVGIYQFHKPSVIETGLLSYRHPGNLPLSLILSIPSLNFSISTSARCFSASCWLLVLKIIVDHRWRTASPSSTNFMHNQFCRLIYACFKRFIFCNPYKLFGKCFSMSDDDDYWVSK